MIHYGDVVEIGLLLPKNWADALVERSKHRHQSIGQIVREMIEHALSEQEKFGQ
jgi:hypothetical protein